MKLPGLKQVAGYLSEVRGELKKVEWPKASEVVKLTLIVIIISGIVAGYLGVLDFGMTKLLELVIRQ